MKITNWWRTHISYPIVVELYKVSTELKLLLPVPSPISPPTSGAFVIKYSLFTCRFPQRKMVIVSSNVKTTLSPPECPYSYPRFPSLQNPVIISFFTSVMLSLFLSVADTIYQFQIRSIILFLILLELSLAFFMINYSFLKVLSSEVSEIFPTYSYSLRWSPSILFSLLNIIIPQYSIVNYFFLCTHSFRKVICAYTFNDCQWFKVSQIFVSVPGFHINKSHTAQPA